MLSSSPPATTTTAHKRLSLNLSGGPRPLHLVDGNVTPLSSPATASSSFRHSAPDTPSPSTSKRLHPRRQSSISYKHSNSSIDQYYARSPLASPGYGLARSQSVGPKSAGSVASSRDRRSVTLEIGPPLERPPLTLAEKHSELLHSIAQKESKCLELRSLLATHEAELLQLKKKWEQIVNRGFLDSSSPSASTTSLNGSGSGAVLEGIKEGVQGVSRFIAAGLSIAELSAPSPSSSVPKSPSSASPMIASSPRTMMREGSGNSRIHHPPRLGHIHANSQSTSSVSTFATKSTSRFSQSSASSIGEEPPPPPPPGTLKGHEYEKEAVEQDLAQILMVHDTGATPTMSPNPAFEQLRMQHQREMQHSISASARGSLEERDLLAGSKMSRRRSKDAHSNGRVSGSPSLPSEREREKERESEERERERQVKARKRASINGTGFPPVSSIPGLASLTVGAAASPPVTSWVGSVGRKWEELQRGTSFSKNQKRASILLSDVSHSFLSALSSPPSASISKSPSPFPSPMPPSYFRPSPTSPMAASTSSTSSASLLDDDDDFTIMPTSASAVMTPDAILPKMKPTPMPDPILQHPKASFIATSHPSSGGSTGKEDEPEDEWNW